MPTESAQAPDCYLQCLFRLSLTRHNERTARIQQNSCHCLEQNAGHRLQIIEVDLVVGVVVAQANALCLLASAAVCSDENGQEKHKPFLQTS